MLHKTCKHELLFIHSMGKKLRISAIATSDDEANEHCGKNDDAVVAVFGPFVIMANKYDNGE